MVFSTDELSDLANAMRFAVFLSQAGVDITYNADANSWNLDTGQIAQMVKNGFNYDFKKDKCNV